LVHQRGGNDGRNDSRHNHAGHRCHRCNQHTGRSEASVSASAWSALAWAWAGLVRLPLLLSALRLPLLLSALLPSGLQHLVRLLRGLPPSAGFSFGTYRASRKWCQPKRTVEVKHLAGSKTLRHATVRTLAR
jgi:hypothetical protein